MPYALERDGEFQETGIYDMFYFRSTNKTQIEAKDLRMIISVV